MRLLGFDAGGGSFRVAAEVYPVTLPENSEPVWCFYDFGTRLDADRFVDESLLSFEYLGCVFTDGPLANTGGLPQPTVAHTAAAA